MDLAAVDALLRAGRLPEALALLEAPTAGADGAWARRHAAVLQALGRAREALAVLRDALARDPGDLALRFDLARADALAGDAANAIAGCRSVLARDPAHAEARLLLGQLLLGAGDAHEALAVLRRAASMRPDDARLPVALAEAEFLCERTDLAGPRFEALVAAAAQPGPILLLRQAQCLRLEGDAAGAHAIAVAAVERHPAFAPLWLERGWCEEDLGDAAAARASYARAQALAPHWADPVACLLNLPPAGDTGALRDVASARLDDAATEPLARAALHHALGRDADRRGDATAAGAHWHAANAQRRAVDGGFDRAAWSARIDALCAAFVAAPEPPADDDALPGAICVVGLPRSGSSLVEAVLSMHPQVHAAGELAVWPRAVEDLGADPIAAARVQATLDAATRGRLAAAWAARARRGAPADTSCIIDKHPDNLLHLGLIAHCLPRLQVVWCRRELRDNALSIYSEGFARSRTWATDLDDIAFVARAYERLVAHWRRVLPCPIVEANYEDLVAAPDAGFRALHAQLGLDWTPAALDFHARDRTVSTLSRWQVRQPIHRGAVGRWRRYAAWFDGAAFR
jgi:tetratricopeptide (TPR) repeat protein